MKTQTLGVVMIVKNEEENLGRILSDIHGVVDEICIVDTGSQDGTISLAKSYGARIEHFPWCDDFSAARNHSIACAESDYLIWLDADDRIHENDRQILADLKSRLQPHKDRAYMLKILSCSEDMPETISYQTRIIPNREGVCFEGRVHEQVIPSLKRSGITVEPVDITVRHVGYHDAAARLGKARRNLDILMKELQAGKDSATRCFFIAMACIGVQDYEQCLTYLSRARQKRTDEDWQHYSYTVSTECLLQLGRIREAYSEITAGITSFPESQLLHYYLGTVCMHEEHYAEAAAAFKRASVLKPLIDTYPIPPDLGITALLQQGKAFEKLGRYDHAIRVYEEAMVSGRDRKSLHGALGLALLRVGKIDDSLNHLGMAKILSDAIDVPLWVSIARIHQHRGNHGDAHTLYLDVLHESPSSLNALAGILDTSIALDDIDTFLSALEHLLILVEIPIPEAPIDSLAEYAELCKKTASRLRERGESTIALHLAETSLRLDPSCAGAHLLMADLYSDQGDASKVISSLEMAAKSGADGLEVSARIEKVRRAVDKTS